MSKALTRSEGVRLRPFAGAKELQDALEKNVLLEISTADQPFKIKHKDRISVPPEEMRVAGLSIEIEDLGQVLSRVSPLVVSTDDVDYLVAAVDGSLSPLRSLEVLARGPLNSLAKRIDLNQRGSRSDSRVLSNPHGPYRIELALVHNKSIKSTSAVKPRVKGALLGKVEFEVRPIGVDDHPKPKRMTKELKDGLGLSKSAWIYIEFTDALLSAETFDDAFNIYVDSDLLDLLVIANPVSKAPIEAAILSNFVHALCYQVRSLLQLGVSDESLDELPGSAVFRLIKKHFTKDSIQELVEKITNSPSLVATQILSSGVLLNSLKSVMEVQEND